MRDFNFRPGKLFLKLAVMFVVGLALVAAICTGLVVPVVVWSEISIWQWMPFNRWAGYVVKGGGCGIVMAGALTTYAWLTQTSASMLKKMLVAVSVGALSVGWSIFLRKYVEWLFQG